MKITQVDVNNFCGIRAVKVAMTTPISLFGGHNHAGKSSLIEAIRAALTGDYSRVAHKKDLSQLVTDGAQKGNASVTVDNQVYKIDLPSGNQAPSKFDAAFIDLVLNNNALAEMTTADRRKTLFALTGCKIGKDLIFEKLAARGCNENKYQALDFTKGFEAAHKSADNKGRESRASWKAITGETYGHKKAENWTAIKPDVEPKDTDFFAAKIAALQNETSELNDYITKLAVENEQAARKNKRICELTSQAEKIDRIKAKLAHDQSELEKHQKKLVNAQSYAALEASLLCPCCNAQLSVVDGKLTEIDKLEHEDNAPTYNVDECQRAVDLFSKAVANDERDLLVAENAAVELEDLGDLDSSASKYDDETRKIKASIAKRQEQINDYHAQIREQDRINEQIKQLESNTEKAAAYHADAVEWASIADALSSDGIPAEILASALNTFNDQLRDVANETNWSQVVIDSDMQITANGRMYNLLSESEKWRVNATIAYAVAQLSNLKMIILDRFDVLDLSSRSTCLKWLHSLANQSKVETVIVCATLKDAPKLPPTFTTYWLENGEVAVKGINHENH